ncbi:NAD(P)-dependent alcohol dehydrogenase [Ornithinimicrobium cryptoxanthini]|uniref:NAD(P)-dependent alcohol dehydrogenase n=1 Tax=Ornithinimicrobium cryptoxanthini TaxID=2934161 RepID=A0ABY4YL51_9MICO|nr:NAD(P)-dependent alcohol dehydrogenase [Ornithinimicrobium cryptoxanthini]USQ77446.1 NAD(P)-dependent alcohol dehydrogenase [Ornithinimicrobium cryptoxanthini]
MRAAVNLRYGPPDVVSVTEVPVPEPGDGELLIRVDATTVNRTDCAYRAARPFFMRSFTGLRRPRRTILGTEFAGEVVGLGEGVDRFAVGDLVFGYCEGRFGAHAEYAVAPQTSSVATVPAGVPLTTAAAATEGFHYARSALRRAGVGPGQHVLVIGATGGIGSAAVQQLAAMGVNVTAVCAGEHADVVLELGADRVVDYLTEDFRDLPQQFHLVFDAVGKSSFGRCRRLLRPDGVYVSSELGPGWQNLPLSLVGTMRRGHRRVVFPFPEDNQSVVEEIRDHLAAGTFRPLIDRTYPLEDIVAAHRFVETGQKIGNVVITLS